MNSRRTSSPRSSGPDARLLSNARGERVKAGLLANKYIRVLLFWVLPYLVINGIIFLLVCSGPKVTIDVKDTNDYVSVEASFTVRSILPVRSVEVTMESQEVEYEKSGGTYTCTLTQNGTLSVRVVGLNGMQKLAFADVSALDDTAPSIDESSAVLSGTMLSFALSDNQSGVDFDSIYGVINDSVTVYPESVDKETGTVSVDLTPDCEYIELRFSDMVGNSRSGRISVVVGGVETEQEDDADRYLDTDTENREE